MIDIDMLCKRNKPLREFCKERIVRLGYDHGFQCRQCPYHHPEKTKVHGIVHKAIQDGIILPPREFGCIRCGGKATLFHHQDYSRPLDVQAMCQSCHCVTHAEMKTHSMSERREP